MKFIKNTLLKLGLNVSLSDDLSNPIARRKRLIAEYGIEVVLDVGANEGQYAVETRKLVGFMGDVLSFEPLASAFQVLDQRSKADQNWSVFNYALGDEEGFQEINIAGNSESSSFLPMLADHVRAAPGSKYVDLQTVSIKRLDDVYPSFELKDKSVYLKVDAQGFEEKVLKGAVESLALIDTIQIEMSLVQLYESEMLFAGMCQLLSSFGYELVGLEPGFADSVSGRLMQVDGIFHRG